MQRHFHTKAISIDKIYIITIELNYDDSINGFNVIIKSIVTIRIQ